MSEKLTTYLQLNGCDDSTYLKVELSKNEVATLKRVFSKLNEASKQTCQPTARIDLKKPDYWEPDYEGEQK